jgi:hypothetical protein
MGSPVLARRPSSRADRLVPSQLTTVAGLVTVLSASSRGCSCAETSPPGPASRIRARSARTQPKQRRGAVDLPSPAALTAGVVQPGSPGTRAADRPSSLVAADQRPHHPAACALGGVAADMLVAAGADWAGGPFRLDRAVASAPVARPGRAGPAAAADRAAREDSLAGPCFPACRADRRHAFVAAVAQVGGGCCGPPGDLAGLPAVPAWPLRSLVARGADRAGIGGPGDGALLAPGRAHAGRAGSAELAASAAVRHPGGRPASPAAPAAFRHDLLVLVIAGRADPALGAPGVDPPGPAAAGACSGAPAGRAGSADPAGGGLAPQVGSDLAAPGQAGAATV